MYIPRTLALAFAALTLSTTFAAATTGAPEYARCHDETTMYIGQLVDGECLHPELAVRRSGYELGWDSTTLRALGGPDGLAEGGMARSGTEPVSR